jgi:predicted MFS family arabinose efflux permease
MFAHRLAPWLSRRGIHYGWVMIALTFLTAFSTAAAMGMPGVLIEPLRAEYGWDTTAISAPLALRLLLYGLMAPFAAALIYRYGVVPVVGWAIGIIVLGLALASQMTQLWELWATWGVMLGFASGMTALVLGATVASRWFTARRGLVLGLLTAANATGQLLFLPLAAWLAEAAGWRWALLPAGLSCLLAGVLMLLFAVDHPSRLGLAPYGETRVQPPPPVVQNAVRASFSTLREASRSRMFWALFITFFICGGSTNGLVQTHFIPLCVDMGMLQVQAASALALMGAFDFVGTILSGWLSDRYNNRGLLFWYYGLRGLSLLYLPYSGFTLVGLTTFAVFYGLDWVATVPPTVRLAAEGFGRERAALVFGWVFTAHQIGAATAALGGGLARDLLGSYMPAFMIAGAACLLGAAVILLLPQRRRPSGVAVAAG